MNLWIKTQDKTTIVKADNKISLFEDLGDVYSIIIKENLNECTVVGRYKTRERALEVLNEIQNDLLEGSGVYGRVYEMPEE